MWTSYCDFWRQGFDFSHKSSRRQFWYPFILNTFITVFISVVCTPWFVNGLRAYKKGVKGSMLPVLLGSTCLIIMFSYGLISMIPRYAVIARRLRDARFSVDYEWLYLVIKVLTYIAIIGGPLFSLMVPTNVVAMWIAVLISIDGVSAVAMLIFMCFPTDYHQIAFLGRWRKKN